MEDLLVIAILFVLLIFLPFISIPLLIIYIPKKYTELRNFGILVYTLSVFLVYIFLTDETISTGGGILLCIFLLTIGIFFMYDSMYKNNQESSTVEESV